MTRTVRARFHHYNRLTNSRNGNPRYELVFSADPFRAPTAEDSAAGFDAANLRSGQDVLLALDHRDHIIGITPTN